MAPGSLASTFHLDENRRHALKEEVNISWVMATTLRQTQYVVIYFKTYMDSNNIPLWPLDLQGDEWYSQQLGHHRRAGSEWPSPIQLAIGSILWRTQTRSRAASSFLNYNAVIKRCGLLVQILFYLLLIQKRFSRKANPFCEASSTVTIAVPLVDMIRVDRSRKLLFVLCSCQDCRIFHRFRK